MLLLNLVVLAKRDEEFQALTNMRTLTVEQKEKIKELSSNVRAAENESESLRGNVETLIHQNHELLRSVN